MPYAPLSVPPDLLCVHRGVAVWRAYNGSFAEDGSMFCYQLRPDAPDDVFDVRTLAERIGRPLTRDNEDDVDVHAAIVADALDAGLLSAQLDPAQPAWADWVAYRDRLAAQGASFATRCPFCHQDDTLAVTAGLFFATAMPLTPDGFSPMDARSFDTDACVVRCDACHTMLPLAFLTL